MGLQIKTLDDKDFLAGESSFDWVGDKGFSPSSSSINPFYLPGTLNFQPSATDRGTNVTDNLVASALDKNFNGNDLYLLGDGGCFYTVSGTTVTKRQTVAADTFALGTSDMVQLNGVTLATGQGRVQALTGSDLSGMTDSFWSGLDSNYRHPLEVVEDAAYVGNVNVIGKITGALATTAAWVTLPTDANVTSLRKHPDGRHLIAFCGITANFSHTRPGAGRIYIINKDTQTWEREIPIDAQVEGSRLIGGVVYVTYGQRLGYFNGSGITFLKKLKTSTTTYSQSMSNLEDALLVRDGKEVLAFADFGRGKGWFRIHNSGGATNLQVVAYKGSSTIMVGDGSNNLDEIDYSASPSISGSFYTNRLDFGQKVKIRRLDIIHTQKASGSILNFNVYYYDENDSTKTIQTVAHPTGPTVSFTRIETDVEAEIFKLNIVPSNGILGIKRIRIYYEPIK